MADSPIVDIHPHMMSRDYERYPLNPLGGKQSTWSKERPITCEELLDAMDRAGVDKAAVVHSSTVYGYDNSYVADSVEQHPDRMKGVCSVDIVAEDAPAKLDYWIGERGMVGLRIFTTGSTMPGQADWFVSPQTFPAWQWVSEHGIPMCVQMTLGGVPLLVQILDRFPDLTVLIDHLCRVTSPANQTDQAAIDAFMALGDRPSVYLKLTTNNVRDFAESPSIKAQLMPALLERFGSDRIAWGSNYPNVKGEMSTLVQEAQTELREFGDETLADILGRTALKIYPALNAA